MNIPDRKTKPRLYMPRVSVDDALGAAMQVKPPAKEKRKAKRKSKK